ncbi:ATP-binding protein [Streptomyces buecherae]|uniref:ATP-binding protein n=1 Tax=Streptomyces buecherae TaxID=2763006 RepID=UPI0037900940
METCKRRSVMPKSSTLPARWRIPLPHTPAAASIARVLVGTALANSHGTEPSDSHHRAQPLTDCGTAELLTTELVCNAVEHTSRQAALELVLEVLPTSCRVEVRDHDPTPLAGLAGGGSPADPVPLSERGRGLLLVRELSSSAGCLTTELGKTVWFTLSFSDGSQDRVAPPSSSREGID